jgi:hypothetical protein
MSAAGGSRRAAADEGTRVTNPQARVRPPVRVVEHGDDVGPDRDELTGLIVDQYGRAAGYVDR